MRPTDPRPAFPSRESPSVRRVMFLDYDWIDLVDLRVRGFARDEITDASGATPSSTTRRSTWRRAVGCSRSSSSTPWSSTSPTSWANRSGKVSAARVRAMHDGGGRPLGLLLDDLPGAMIAAGYVHAMERSIGLGTTLSDVDHDEMPRSFQQADLCSGWRSDGTMMIAVYAGEPLPFEPIAEVPQVPEGAGGWPEAMIPVPGLRRYRRIDVVPDGAVWRIDAWFRDTYRNSDGECGVLHEYTVRAVADAVDHTLLEVSAIPHALPWKECPAAGEMVRKLVGAHLEGLRSSVPKVLQGIESCTHLTNELRELADVPYLAASLANA